MLVTLMSRQRASSYFEVRSDVTPRSAALGLTTSFVFSAFAEECHATVAPPAGGWRPTRNSIHSWLALASAEERLQQAFDQN